MVARSMDVLRRLLPVTLAATAVAAAGCGGATGTASDAQARRVVSEFANAHDARACDLLTVDALRNVYGGYTAPPQKAKRNCISRSRHFKGAKVTTTDLTKVDADTVKVGALSADGKISYTVTLRRKGARRWQIDQIAQSKTQ